MKPFSPELRPRRPRADRIPATVVAGVILLSGCEAGEAARVQSVREVPEAERYGGTAVVAATADINDIGPITWGSRYAQFMQVHVLFTPLVRYNERLEVEPYGAESWSVNEEGTEITFRLRRDLRWHDDRPTTARDWKLAYDLARDPDSGYLMTAYWTHYEEAEAVDSFTFRVRMRPHAEFLDPWTAFVPVPSHILAGVAPGRLKEHPYGTRAPVGNGPFRFVSRKPGESWTFEANFDFPEALGGRPYLDRLVYRAIPEQTTLLAELLTGGVDVYLRPPAEQAERIRRSGVARLLHYPDRVNTHIEWNHRRPPFNDPRVRRALTLAIDREAIVRAVRHGYGEVAHSSVPPVFWQHDPRIGGEMMYARDRARLLLQEAGYADRDGDGVVESPEGRPFHFTLLTSHGDSERADIAQMVQADLREVGVEALPRLMEFNALLARLYDTRRRDYDAVIIAGRPEFRQDDSDAFHCRKRDLPFAIAGYCNPLTDRLLDTLPTLTDRAAAMPVWREYQRRIVADQPFSFLFYSHTLLGVSNRMRDIRPDVRADWVGVNRWWIDPKLRRP